MILFIAVTTTASQIQILTLLNSTKKLRPQQYHSHCRCLSANLRVTVMNAVDRCALNVDCLNSVSVQENCVQIIWCLEISHLKNTTMQHSRSYTREQGSRWHEKGIEMSLLGSLYRERHCVKVGSNMFPLVASVRSAKNVRVCKRDHISCRYACAQNFANDDRRAIHEEHYWWPETTILH